MNNTLIQNNIVLKAVALSGTRHLADVTDYDFLLETSRTLHAIYDDMWRLKTSGVDYALEPTGTLIATICQAMVVDLITQTMPVIEGFDIEGIGEDLCILTRLVVWICNVCDEDGLADVLAQSFYHMGESYDRAEREALAELTRLHN